MLPYLQVQALYLLASALAVFALDRLAVRNQRLAKRPRVRLLSVAAVLAVAVLAAMFVVRALDGSHSKYQFGAIAIGFYSATLWLPALALVGAIRRPRDVALGAAAIVAVAVGQYSLWIEPNRLVTNTHALEFPQWRAGEELRVVHLSDLQTVGECAREAEAAAIVASMQPDLIVVTGDYVAGPFFDPEPAIAAARKFFAALAPPKYGIVCVPGHSEPESVRQRVFDGFDVRYLRNEELELDVRGGRKLRIFGTRTLNLGFDLSRFETRREAGLVTLVASHEPEVSWEIEGRGVDLHLAGHTHGGQICLPFFGAPMTLSELPRRFARGLHAFGDHWLHVNAGIGMEGNHAPRIRFACPPEIDLLLLRGGGAERAPAPVPPRS